MAADTLGLPFAVSLLPLLSCTHTLMPASLLNLLTACFHHSVSPHFTQLSTLVHPCALRSLYSSIPFIGKLWNSLTLSIFLPHYNCFLEGSIKTLLQPKLLTLETSLHAVCERIALQDLAMFNCAIEVSTDVQNEEKKFLNGYHDLESFD